MPEDRPETQDLAHRTMLDEAAQRLVEGRLHDPFQVLGRHPFADGSGRWVLRAFMPSAERVWLEDGRELVRRPGTDLFECVLDAEAHAALPRHYALEWIEKHDGSRHRAISPYSFDPLIPDDDLLFFNQGRHHHVYRHLGAHFDVIDGIEGVRFAVWAPAVERVSVIGDFNGWHGLRHPMRSRGGSGVWELFVSGLRPGDQYKFELRNRFGHILVKTDPYAFRMNLRPDTACRVAGPSAHRWGDGDWLRRRAEWDWQHQPMSVYEVHLGSWQRAEDGGFLNYREIARRLVPWVRELGFTHVELMPVMEHPLDESWGYQVTGYFAPTARHGSPDDLRWFIDHCHQHGIGVILDWVPGHFPRDEHALARYTGEPLYEHPDPRRGEHRDWGTLIFDYGRNEVKNFLLTNAVYWLEEFHADGLRVDAVASMLYLDYSRPPGEWVPNVHGGRENLEAITFLQEVNTLLHELFPGALTIAEESTSWPMVSRPVWTGGLGFSMKWNMGWMNDSLRYFAEDPIHRRWHHDLLTFGLLYAWTENFVLPLSHDEVVHGKRSLLDKMPGDHWQKFANLRLLLAWQATHPGKKLLFMGGELAQWHEWRVHEALDWALLEHPAHAGIRRLVADLNHLYTSHPALHRHDFEAEGFEWLDCHDREQSVLSFVRRGDGRELVCVFNFTPVPRPGYRIGLPRASDYRVLLNSDSEHYGGSNVGQDRVAQEATPWMSRPQSGTIDLPPLGMLILEACE